MERWWFGIRAMVQQIVIGTVTEWGNVHVRVWIEDGGVKMSELIREIREKYQSEGKERHKKAKQ